jgi:hypothetical protein
MNVAAILGAALGLAFIYLLLSLVCSTVQEWVATLLRRRHANLHAGLVAMLDGNENVNRLYEDPMLQTFMARSIFTKKPQKSSVAYLHAQRFSNALASCFLSAALMPGADLIEKIKELPNNRLRGVLLTFAMRVEGDREKFLALVEKWYDDTMERVSGWYRRETQLIIIGIAIATTILVNVDTIRIVTKFYNDPLARERITALADKWIADNAPDGDPRTLETRTPEQLRGELDRYINSLDETDLPLWWKSSDFKGWRKEFARTFPDAWDGWLITVIAISLGAPFWFDVLMKVANLRANGPKPRRDTPAEER